MALEADDILREMMDRRDILAEPDPEVDTGGIVDMGTLKENPLIFPEGEYPHTVDFDVLQFTPRFFCDLAICPNSYRRVVDMYMYWGWTGACIGQIRAKYDEREEELPISDLLSHVETLLRFALEDGKIALKMKSEGPRFDTPMTWMGDSKRATGYMAFAILEGLADELGPGRRDYGEHLRAVDGLNDPAEMAYSEVDDLDHPSDPLPSYREALQHKAPDYLEGMKEKPNGFFGVLREVRNAMLHGDGAGGRFAACAVTLCCMLVWGAIDSGIYEEIRSEQLTYIKQQMIVLDDGGSLMQPIEFYPLTGTEITMEEARDFAH